MMPSYLSPLEFTRSYTLQIEESPRYGNFQGADHLPTVKGRRAGQHYIPYFTNQQIFKMVSGWMESWQPWQQKVLLYGIADRLPVHQIDVLATTLEPMYHRDYVTAFRQRYPCTPFKEDKNQDLQLTSLTPDTICSPIQSKPLKDKTPSLRDEPTVCIRTDDNESNHVKQNNPITYVQVESETDPSRGESRSEYQPRSVISGTDKFHLDVLKSPTLIEESQLDMLKSQSHLLTESLSLPMEAMSDTEKSQFIAKESQQVKNGTQTAVTSKSEGNISISSLHMPPDDRDTATATQIISISTLANLAKFANDTALDIVNSAIEAAAWISKYDQQFKGTAERGHKLEGTAGHDQDTVSNEILEDINEEKTDKESQENHKNDISGIIDAGEDKPTQMLRVGDSSDLTNMGAVSERNKKIIMEEHQPSRPKQHGNGVNILTENEIYVDSADILQPVKSLQSPRNHRIPLSQSVWLEGGSNKPSGLSVYTKEGPSRLARLAKSENMEEGPSRLGRLANTPVSPYTYLSTPDFFLRDRVEKLGPMQKERHRLGRPYSDQADTFVALHLTYKNVKWWPEQPTDGRVYVKARKRELLQHYRQQLQQIWQWLNLWADYERVLLLKEIIKVATTEVLSNFAGYIQQRLRDIRDINQLSDKLLLQLFSYLSPVDIGRTAQVCRRWRYLCATDKLWRVKCQQMGHTEGLGDMSGLVMKGSGGGLDVDWRKAFRELEAITRDARQAIALPTALSCDVPSPEVMVREDTSYPTQVQAAMIPSRSSGIVEDIPLHCGMESILRGRRVDGEEDEDGDSDVSEDIMMLRTDYEYCSTEALEKKKQWSKPKRCVRKVQLSGEVHVGPIQEENGDGDTVTDGPRPLKAVLRKEREGEKLDDLAFDIRPHLVQSKDLLGKSQARSSLDWEQPTNNQYTTPANPKLIRAGSVQGIKKVRKLQGHLGGVLCVHFDQRRLVSGGWDRSIRLWDIRSGRSVHKFYGHKGGVRCIQFDDEIMVSGSWDMTIMVWCMRSFTRRVVLHEHRGCVSCLTLHPDYIVSGSHDSSVRVYHRKTYLCYKVISGHQGPINCLTFDGSVVISGSDDRTLRMTNIHSGELLQVFEGLQEAVVSIWSQGSLVISGDSLGRVCFWNRATGESEAAIQAHDMSINSLSFSGRRFFTASGDCTIKEWDMDTMTAVRLLDGHKGPIQQIVVSASRIVSCSEDGNIRVWDLTTPSSEKASRRKGFNQKMDPKNSRGKTALQAASLQGHLEIVTLLLVAGVNLELQDEFGYTALDYSPCSVPVLKYIYKTCTRLPTLSVR